MHIYIKQEFASFQDTYFGYTNAEEQRYSIKDNSFLPWHKVEIKDNTGVIATIKQKSFGLKPNYAVFDVAARMEYELHRIGDIKTGSYSVAGKFWHVFGDFIGLDFSIIDNSGTQIASLSQHETPIGEAIDIYVIDEKDSAIALAILFSVFLDQKDAVFKLKKQENGEK